MDSITETTNANKVWPKAGRNGFDWTFAQNSTSILRSKFSDKIIANTMPVSGNQHQPHIQTELSPSPINRLKITSLKRSSFLSPHIPKAPITGITVLPKSVKLYSTFGGTTA
jgi:hypothetical protein